MRIQNRHNRCDRALQENCPLNLLPSLIAHSNFVSDEVHSARSRQDTVK